MARVSKKTASATVPFDNFAELWERLGEVPLDRIRMNPLPGSATEKDVLAAEAEPRKRRCELIDGVLVEKAIGIQKSFLTMSMVCFLGNFVAREHPGFVLGEGGTLRLFPGHVRIPDVSYIFWERIQGGKLPDEPIPDLAPDLAIEVLSPSNTKKEMARKLRDYFKSGTQLVWLIQPKTETAEVYTSPTDRRRIAKGGTLDGGAVLPGFRLSLKELFASTTGRKRR